MISHNQQLKITKKLHEKTGVDDWLIGPTKIEARECIVYKAINDNYKHAVAVKVYRNSTNKSFFTQYDVLKRFSEELNPKKNTYYVPQVYGSLSEEGIFLMEWIESPNLQRRLWRYFYSKKHVQNDMTRCFEWLKEFHALSGLKLKAVDIGIYHRILNRSTKENQALSKNNVYKTALEYFNNLSDNYKGLEVLHANIHGDFTPTNVLIDDEKVTAIDMFGNQHLPVANDIALQFSYIAIEYPNMLTRSDFKLPPEEWPLLKLILESYEYPKDKKQLNFFLYVFLYQLLRRWVGIKHRSLDTKTTWLDKRRLKNSEMIVTNLTETLKNIHS